MFKILNDYEHGDGLVHWADPQKSSIHIALCDKTNNFPNLTLKPDLVYVTCPECLELYNSR